MKVYENIIQGSDEWFAIRCGKVTGSMFAIAKGNGATRTKYMKELVDELRTGNPRESFVNSHMQRGTEMEPFARAAYEKEYRVDVQEVGFVEFNENIGCSPDGIIEPDGRLEIKCPTLEVHNKTVQADKVPSSHKPQIQGTLWVTEGKWLDFISYHPDAEQPLFVKRVYPDEKYITELKIRIYMFIADMKVMIKETEDSRKDSKMSEYNGQAHVKAVGKYKEQFKSTGLLLVVNGNEFWSDFPGQLNYKEWKEKDISINITQNEKGYWSGMIVGQQDAGPSGAGPGSSSGPTDVPRPSNSAGPCHTTETHHEQEPFSQEKKPARDIQDEIRFAQSLNLACQDKCHEMIDDCGIHARVMVYYQILKTRQFPANMSSTSDIMNTPVEQDDIPFP